VLGVVEDERYLRVALYQGVPTGKRKGTMEFAMGNEISAVQRADPTLVACALGRNRFYLYSQREPSDTDDVSQVTLKGGITSS
jgi:peptidylprolyl isomerase domain and WD repeat-containing protein 1